MNIYWHNNAFVDNKATVEYYNIITTAQSKNRKKLSRSDPDFVYYESHHVLPKSIFPEYKDSKWNKVLLTGKEHYLCHKLLLEMTSGSNYHRMVHAYWNMATRKTDNMDRVELTEEEYEILREEFSKSRTVLQKGNVCKESTKKLIGDANRGRTPSASAITNSVNARKGKKKPAEAVKLSADAQKGNTNVRGKTWWNNGIVGTMSFTAPDATWRKGRLQFTDSHRKNISKSQKGNTKKRDWLNRRAATDRLNTH
jgi:hypothetical protein